VFAAALLENMGSERIGHLFIEQTFFLEKRKSIGIKHFCPFVPIIACCIPTLKNVTERGREEGSGHFGQHIGSRKDLLFETAQIANKGLFELMPGHIGHSKTQLAQGEIPGEKLLALPDFCNQLVRNHLAGLIMQGKGFQKSLFWQPILHDL